MFDSTCLIRAKHYNVILILIILYDMLQHFFKDNSNTISKPQRFNEWAWKWYKSYAMAFSVSAP